MSALISSTGLVFSLICIIVGVISVIVDAMELLLQLPWLYIGMGIVIAIVIGVLLWACEVFENSI